MATKARSATVSASLESSLKEVCAKLHVSRDKALLFAVDAALAKLRERDSAARELSSVLMSLPDYRQRDPDHEHAIAAFVSAEAGHPDPVEGSAYRSTSPLRRSLSEVLHG